MATKFLDLAAKHFGSVNEMPVGKNVAIGGEKSGYFAKLMRMDADRAPEDRRNCKFGAVVAWPTMTREDTEHSSQMCSCPWRFRPHAHMVRYAETAEQLAPILDAAIEALARNDHPSLPGFAEQ